MRRALIAGLLACMVACAYAAEAANDADAPAPDTDEEEVTEQEIEEFEFQEEGVDEGAAGRKLLGGEGRNLLAKYHCHRKCTGCRQICRIKPRGCVLICKRCYRYCHRH